MQTILSRRFCIQNIDRYEHIIFFCIVYRYDIIVNIILRNKLDMRLCWSKLALRILIYRIEPNRIFFSLSFPTNKFFKKFFYNNYILGNKFVLFSGA